jgi:shikimate kinase
VRDASTIRRVLLVGFMGSGKTLVGQALARRLGWGFRDFDQEVKIRTGLPIPEIFRQHGEAHFREMERQIGQEALSMESVVLASGGGWPVALRRLEELPVGTLSVWLTVTAEEAVRRVRKDGPTRPLLAVDEPLSRAQELLSAREIFYQKADVALDSQDRDPDELARRIEELMNESGRGLFPSTSA